MISTSNPISNTKVTVAYGDGIGPEIMDATLRILDAAGAKIEPEVIEIGEKVYKSGSKAGIQPSDWESLRRNKVFLKAPITTPQGGGYKSLNVTARTTLGLFANVRPCMAYSPYVETKHPLLDLVIIRENEEDLYTGIEHRQTNQMTQCLKLISRPGCEKIIRYAFEYARAYNRRKVTCLSKDNIMKMTDGLFHRVFDEIAAEYPDIEKEHWIIDIGSALLADEPERFGVIVTLNLYGDIISDIAAQIAGSVGMGGSANVGDQCAMFEAIHGSAPDIAGRGIANPSGLLNGAIMMLVHIGQGEVAAQVHNAWLKTIEDGIHTGDVYQEGVSKERVGTKGFADAVIARLGQTPEHFKTISYAAAPKPIHISSASQTPQKKELVGVDIFLDWNEGTARQLGDAISALSDSPLELKMITNRGVKVYPDGVPETFCTDHWRCRFKGKAGLDGALDKTTIWKQLALLNEKGFDTIKTENLYTFDGEVGYSLMQGE
ncbi:NADP-dependent isocitrate dehydrogenase [Persicitalea jodogahamensis]|uniref:Isocitrate dehydrogenase [NADP] n=1 Tax=Persicitalea jodogahamensis TaxID=402147 RepID=A0A8J3D7U6_9BACT|nr:NADP-dependent isocitrate dehydrogenase [Persicitalea jodogahamensis]GHB85837.1 isocitrate dehydrogenase [Persicitalea jodogahamensis]